MKGIGDYYTHIFSTEFSTRASRGCFFLVSQSVKEVLQSLIDDNLVQSDKIGSSNCRWLASRHSVSRSIDDYNFNAATRSLACFAHVGLTDSDRVHAVFWSFPSQRGAIVSLLHVTPTLTVPRANRLHAANIMKPNCRCKTASMAQPKHKPQAKNNWRSCTRLLPQSVLLDLEA